MDKQDTLPSLQQLLVDGKPMFGVFDSVKHVNYLDYHSYLLSGKKVSQWRKKLRANQFCFVQIVQHPYRICFAVATLNWVTSCFCYVYKQDDDELKLVEALQPFTKNTTFNQSTYTDKIEFKSKNLTINLKFGLEQLSLTLSSKILDINATFDRVAKPLAVCTPTAKTGWTYTQKEPMRVVDGSILLKETDNSENTINLKNATASLDWSLGYMRRKTNWFWACMTEYLTDGKHFALNLATGVNETGASENACWLDGQRYHLPAVMFERNKDNQTWVIKNQVLNWSKVKISLEFTPINCYQKNDRLLIVDSMFEQWVGHYTGSIILDDKEIILNKVLGLAEDHYAKW